MTPGRRIQLTAIAAPIVLGVATLVAMPWLLPSSTELRGVDQRVHPAAPRGELAAALAPVPIPTPVPVVAPLSATPPSLADRIDDADAPTLAAMTAQLIADGARVTTAGVAHDLVAAGRPQVALAYLAARPDGATPATWRQRFDLYRATGDHARATALLSTASAGRTGAPAADVIAAGYAMNRPDLILRAAATGAIPVPDATLTLDLARRLEAGGRVGEIAALDRIARFDWRAADPWLAMRVAERAGDKAAAIRAAALLPPKDRAAAEQAILQRSGNRAELLAAVRRQADQPGADRAAIAERLLALGDRPGAIAALRLAAADAPPGAAVARRLLYLMGPRPEAVDIAWLKRRATTGPASAQQDWLLAYAERDTPRDASAVLAHHPLAARNEVLVTRLRLAKTTGDDDAGRAALTQLLDGRVLTRADLSQIADLAPRSLSPATASTLARRRGEQGLIAPQERMDLAWRAWNRGDATATAAALKDYLADRPDDVAALRLMGDAQARLSGDRAARPWFERALTRTETPSRAGAELLDRLGRRAEATRVVAALRSVRPSDRSLAAFHARLLIAQGEPGRARAVLAP